MPQAEYVQEGETIDYTPVADVAAGDVVVQGELVGIAKLDIKSGKLGGLAVAGVFDFAKATGVGTAIAVGANLYWDDTNNVATTTAAGNKLLGKSIRAADDDDTTVRGRLLQ